ncbi:hypothetical protein CONPUDRAFT_137497 [Coniophora puteana RWD-64-598 SS2]|uniref:CFEM domain-containing protein n=1 Tax=Coniophora puteana (strain RWD-64-598) TaxID=741705 RepID=A0A5M3MLQ9_CONPW|nr:uncharacterized protein CONPUDRAFT_137497 [Coniophora puteana RWD-64-598 SS2]EIW80159.1 hypothetical protein CONPUDRAFT_137497 [Coniophora puteana RWD-64-598 SS2]
MFAKSVVVTLIFALGVLAQDSSSASGSGSATGSSAAPTSTAGIDSCILQCVTQAASAGGCSSVTDLSCVCMSTQFQGAALSCLQANCTSSDVSAATQLQQQECAGFSLALTDMSSGSGSMTMTGSMSGMSMPMGSSTSPASTGSGNGAVGLVSKQGLAGISVAAIGALVGAVLVL